MRLVSGCFALLLSVLTISPATGADWPQFRGPNGSGVSPDANPPLEWSDSKNLKWKTPLPGPGASSPIVSGERIFVTCYSGYGVDQGNPGVLENLKRHLVCIDRSTGEIVWSKSVDAALPEDPYSGMGVPEHGYASNTPAADGKTVFAFFGKSGVTAFDFEGNQLWAADVGHESSARRWGSSASVILHKQMVLVNASEESLSVYALDKTTGKEVWKAEANSLEYAYNTPIIVDLGEAGQEFVIPVPYEVWALNPDTGKLKWYLETGLDGNISPSAVSEDGIVYVTGGLRSKGTVAIRTGGDGDVAESNLLWTSRDASYVPSPVLYKANLYWVNDQGIAFCLEAKTGSTVYQERLSGLAGGGRGKPVYASVAVAAGKLYCVSRTAGTFVLAAKPEFEQLAHNQFESDQSQFNASAVPVDGQILLRSNRFLYCIEADSN